MKPEWIDVGPLADFPMDAPALRKGGGLRFACVRRGDAVDALDDRCPHQGYPLSQGTVRDGVLTCEWHNWKFETATGACTFGGEGVRRYPSRVEAGHVHLDVAVDVERETARAVDGLRRALADNGAERALREGLRLDRLASVEGPARLGRAFSLLAQDGAERAEYGFDHGLAGLADLVSWAERGWVAPEEAFVLAAVAVGEPSVHLGKRAVVALERELEGADDPAAVAPALVDERRAEAEARVRAVVRVHGVEVAVREGLLPFASRHVLDYGHGAIFLAKARELARRFPEAAEEVLAASAVELGWATAETQLPPFTATRQAVARVAGLRLAPTPGAAPARAGFEEEVLAGERRSVEAVVEALTKGADPVELLRALAHAAAERLARFDPAWEARVDAEIGVLDVTHAGTFTEAALALAPGAPVEVVARLAVLAAGFLGKLRKADGPAPQAGRAAHGSLLEAARARDLASALGIAAELDAASRRAAYAELAPFLALEAAVRPIRYVHTIKNGEALRRLDEADPSADGAYLRALLAFAVPARPERNVRRMAHVARAFLADGRPPEGLY